MAHRKRGRSDYEELSAMMADDMNADLDLEPLTEALIAELQSKGIPANDLYELAKNGFRYSRARDSFFTPWQA